TVCAWWRLSWHLPPTVLKVTTSPGQSQLVSYGGARQQAARLKETALTRRQYLNISDLLRTSGKLWKTVDQFGVGKVYLALQAENNL
ncbi:MAG: hypothetical protein ACXWR1_22280, partial [Bdellovibrionota bacterium]